MKIKINISINKQISINKHTDLIQINIIIILLMILKFNSYFLTEFILLILFNTQGIVKLSSVTIGTAIVPNQCGHLGSNNPLRKLDCSIFKLSKGMCCLLTITSSDEETDDDGVTSIVESYKTACIILDKIDAKIINKTSQQYKYLGDVLIECSQRYFRYSLAFILLITLLCL